MCRKLLCSYIAFAKMNLCIFAQVYFMLVYQYVQIMHKLDGDKIQRKVQGQGL